MGLEPGPEMWIWKGSSQKVDEITGVHENAKVRGGAHSSGKGKVYKDLRGNSLRGRRRETMVCLKPGK